MSCWMCYSRRSSSWENPLLSNSRWLLLPTSWHQYIFMVRSFSLNNCFNTVCSTNKPGDGNVSAYTNSLVSVPECPFLCLQTDKYKDVRAAKVTLIFSLLLRCRVINACKRLWVTTRRPTTIICMHAVSPTIYQSNCK